MDRKVSIFLCFIFKRERRICLAADFAGTWHKDLANRLILACYLLSDLKAKLVSRKKRMSCVSPIGFFYELPAPL
ncbi:hypothetical protein Lbir_1571 [Legionella birminghamensis]|uniref:Transposase n=1 Tax=Legionella birminghamensis TaxID=28083 RepID=A0ABR5QIE0_9GAMM|nr:hypothetical protein Lbir_1571 [Legionella birminghamensis]